MSILGTWIAVGLTLFMFSFLYKDNPFYKIGENLYVGITIGYSIVKLVFETWIPNVWHVVHPEAGVWFENREWWLLIPPLILGVLVLSRFVPKYAWLSRWTFAFVVGYGSGLAIPATFTTSIQKQAEGTAHPLVTQIESVDSAEAKAKDAEKVAEDLAKSKGAGSEEAMAAKVDAEEYRERADAAKGKVEAVAKADVKAKDMEKAAIEARKIADEADKKGSSSPDEVKNAIGAAGKALDEKRTGTARDELHKAEVYFEKEQAGSDEVRAAVKLALVSLRKEPSDPDAARIAVTSAQDALKEEARDLSKKADAAERKAVSARVATWSAYSQTKYSLLTAWNDFTTIILFLGVFCVLFYFFFSIEHKGPVKVCSRLGIVFLMIYFGASYGYTVMGRLSLLYGRLVSLRDACRIKEAWCATPILLVLMVAVLAALHFKNKGQEEQA